MWKTEGLKQALDKFGFDAAFGGARRDEEKSRAKERIISFRSNNHRWDPKNQCPELWRLYNTRKAKGESLRVFPISNWTELDIWQCTHLYNIPIVPLYFAASRPTVERDGLLIMMDDDRLPLREGESAGKPIYSLSNSGVLPPDGRRREHRRHAARDHQGNVADHDVGTAGQGDRSRSGRVHGEEKAGRVFLMVVHTEVAAIRYRTLLPQTSMPICFSTNTKPSLGLSRVVPSMTESRL
jgi:sulfate adenylyltransferase subunit 2